MRYALLIYRHEDTAVSGGERERREEQFTAILDGCGHVACYPPAVQGPARPTRRATERGRHRPAIEHAGPSRGAGRIRRQVPLAAHAWCLAQAGSEPRAQRHAGHHLEASVRV